MRSRTTKKEIEITGVLASRLTSDGKRKISLDERERFALRHQTKIERAVALFLDLEAGHSRDEICKELGMSPSALKDLTKTQQFMDAYDAHFVELGHDPRLKATQQAIADLLPRAVTEMRRMLIDPDTSATVRLSIIKEIFRYAGIQEPTPAKSDKAELAEFLKGMGSGVTVENMNVAVMAPPPQRPVIVDASDAGN